MSNFRDRLVTCCEQILKAAEHCTNEEATKTSMVMPFLNVLGYNPFDPTEVKPEHHADFSEKNKNRVDYAICRNDQPIIAIEAKLNGATIESDRGQLRGYFNAVPSIKLGILTNGLRYECFADTDAPNIMDQTPFLTFDITDVVENKVADHVVFGINDLQKSRFDPTNIGAEARRKLLLSDFVQVLHRWRTAPSDDLIRLLLEEAGHRAQKKTRRVIEDSRDLAAQAFASFIDRVILERIGIRPEETQEKAQETETPPEQSPKAVAGIVTTETELAVYGQAIRRLAFLVDDPYLFDQIEHVQIQDMKTTFRVFYKKTRLGILFNFREGPNGELRFSFPDVEEEISATTIADIDKYLLTIFKRRVAELGTPTEPARSNRSA